MQIAGRQIEAAYAVASKVFDKLIAPEAGATELNSQHGLNINSARDFINDHRLMLRGKVFQRAMSAPATNFFLTKIAEDRGERAAKAAVSSVRKHIDYYEGIRKLRLHSLRSVVDRHDARLKAPSSLEDEKKRFEAAVSRALSESADKRRSRLRNASRIPAKMKVFTVVFQRNPDVVAEVLHRAGGICERCSKPAPFLKARDGAPYLEVHHRIQLADGGEDVVENALALCPNCHRELHFGPKIAELASA